VTELQGQNQNYVQEQEIHLADYINIVLRRRNIFVSTFLAIFVGVFLVTFLMHPVYQAASTVYIKKDSGKMGINDLLMSGSDNSIQAEIEIIKSRTIAEQVVRKLNLDWVIKPSSASSSCTITDVSGMPSAKALTLTMTGKERYDVDDGSGNRLGAGRNGLPLRLPGGMLTVQLRGKQGDSFELIRLPLYNAVAALRTLAKIT